jgi:acyl-CoA-dependent ceramide synthase
LTPHLKPLLEPLAPALGPYVPNGRITNPFGPMFLLSGKIATSDPDDPRYAKDWCDLLFLAYNVIFFSCFRQLVTVTMFRRIAKYFGIKKEAKLDRFGEQGYAVVYFGITGAWGLVSLVTPFVPVRLPIRYLQHIMSELPTWWYRTEYFWIGTSTVPRTRFILIYFYRLSSLGHEASTQALLPNANVLLAPAAHRASPWPREA